jgi:hypothetical protein
MKKARTGLILSVILFFIMIFTSFESLTAKEDNQSQACYYVGVYCKARTDRIALIKGPTVKVRRCNLDGAVNEAMRRLMNFCSATTCQRPITCVALDETDYEVEVSYLPR